MTIPDAPINFANNAALTAATQIGLTWSEGLSNGGTPVISYRLSFDQGTNTFVIAASGITTKYFTVTGLTPGTTYKFKIEARNVFGYSVFSQVIQILAA